MSEKESIDINYLARLARLELTEEEKADYSSQLEQILGHFQALSEVDVEGVEPIAHPFELENVWREDEIKADWSVEQSLANAPQSRQNQIVVPKIVDDA